MKFKAYQDLEQAVALWCQDRPDILAAIAIGSRGRLASPTDQYSDLDLILFSSKVDWYEKSRDWLEQFGELWITKLNRVGPGDPEWMAFYAPGIKVDFLLVAATMDQSLASALDSLPYQQVLTRGFRVLYQGEAVSGERVNTSARHRPAPIPSQQEFHRELNSTLFTTERFVKFTVRGDTWRSQYTFHSELMSHLLTFIEWHSRLVANTGSDSWYEGRYMENWADKRVIYAIQQLTPGLDLIQQQDALAALLDLLDLLASETASHLGYTFPTAGQRTMITWLLETMHEPT